MTKMTEYIRDLVGNDNELWDKLKEIAYEYIDMSEIGRGISVIDVLNTGIGLNCHKKYFIVCGSDINCYCCEQDILIFVGDSYEAVVKYIKDNILHKRHFELTPETADGNTYFNFPSNHEFYRLLYTGTKGIQCSVAFFDLQFFNRKWVINTIKSLANDMKCELKLENNNETNRN